MLQPIGVHSVDGFIREFSDVLKRFGALTDDVERKRFRIDDETGFSWYKAFGTSLRTSILGMLLQFLALTNGDLTKFSIETPAWRPYLRFVLNGISADGVDRQIDAVNNYLESMPEVAEDKLPALLVEAQQALEKLPGVQENAQADINTLSDV